MDNAVKDYQTAMKAFEMEVMMHVNEQLHRKGQITTEMYIKAKELILKSCL